jgi:hypothetical protein
MAGCLQERGFSVVGWTKAGKAPKVVAAKAPPKEHGTP